MNSKNEKCYKWLSFQNDCMHCRSVFSPLSCVKPSMTKLSVAMKQMEPTFTFGHVQDGEEVTVHKVMYSCNQS